MMVDNEILSWYESYYYDTPLKHERETVYKKYLYDFITTLIDEVKDDIKGKSFWDYLESNFYDEEYSY